MSSKPTRMRFSRRSLLRGLGAGAALFGPFLRHRSSMAQSSPAGTPPGNLLIFFTPNGHKRALTANGVTTPCFDATGSESSLTLGTALTPLQPFVNDVSIIKGLNLKTPTFIASHQDICRILTCWGAPKEGNDETQFTAFGPSIDQSIGQALNLKPLVVAVDPYRDAQHWRTALSWSASGVVAPFVKDHQAVFDDLFGGLPAPASAPKGNWLDSVRSSIATFGTRVNSQNRAHLDAYLTAVHSLQRKTKLTAVSPASPVRPAACTTNTLAARIAALPAQAPVQVDDKSAGGVVAEMQARGELWMDMMAMAFACGSRRVGVIQWQGASEGYDPAGDLGSPTHHSTTEGAFPPEHWVAIDTWYAQRFAYQLAALKQLGILDRTIVVWVSEITEAHNQVDMVTVVAGGQLLGMKTGQYIRYPLTGMEIDGFESIPVAQDPANRSLSDLWVTVQQALGVNQATFGDPKWNTGPLTELRG
jgi:Protein of unknown function (DUF1552)